MNHNQKRNYQKELDRLIEQTCDGQVVPRLLLHSCCAPCSSYVIQYLSQYFEVTVYYYNPNIDLPEEYGKRAREQERLVERMETSHPVHVVLGAYEPEEFYQIVRGLEDEPEGGKRCTKCFELRLREAAKVAGAGNYDYFTTTLSISPLKDAKRLNEIGERMGKEYQVNYLPSDFKKKDGYKQSVALSQAYGLYRQNYCGCSFSKKQ